MNTQMDTMEKLRILTDAAKYDAACTSSGVNRAGVKGQLWLCRRVPVSATALQVTAGASPF